MLTHLLEDEKATGENILVKEEDLLGWSNNESVCKTADALDRLTEKQLGYRFDDPDFKDGEYYFLNYWLDNFDELWVVVCQLKGFYRRAADCGNAVVFYVS